VHLSTPADVSVEQRDGRIVLTGDLRLHHGAEIWRGLRAASDDLPPGERVDLDLAEARSIDGAVAALVVAFRRRSHELGGRTEIVGANDQVRRLLELHRAYDPPRQVIPRARRGPVAWFGDLVVGAARAVYRAVEFVGELAMAVGGVVMRPVTGNWRAVFGLAARAGTDGVPIVLMLDFLVGFVMGYESARQLQIYGANVFVADVVGISVTRELGPLVTGIIVIGRSGAAFTAEIGTMKVSDELDALRTMGISPPRYLVLPRILALALVSPALTLLGDVVGVSGGAVVGAVSLGVSLNAYLNELRTAVFVNDLVGGMIKSFVFGLVTAIIACQKGLATTGGATGVGRQTTSTVVTSLFAVIVIDAIFAVILRVLHQ